MECDVTTINFSQVNAAELIRKYRFHDSDVGCMTMEQECRRMYLLQEIGAELQRRNIELPE
jgi:hypothetical protein